MENEHAQSLNFFEISRIKLQKEGIHLLKKLKKVMKKFPTSSKKIILFEEIQKSAPILFNISQDFNTDLESKF